jgi:hypothetical protein
MRTVPGTQRSRTAMGRHSGACAGAGEGVGQGVPVGAAVDDEVMRLRVGEAGGVGVRDGSAVAVSVGKAVGVTGGGMRPLAVQMSLGKFRPLAQTPMYVGSDSDRPPSETPMTANSSEPMLAAAINRAPSPLHATLSFGPMPPVP